MVSERLTFAGSTGHALAAILDRPDGAPRAYCLFAHAFGSSKDLRGAARISRALVEKGIAVLRFDFTGLGQSEGRFADTNFRTNLADVRAAADHLRAAYEAPKILVGHSLGGAAVLGAARDVPEATAVATIAAPSDTKHLREKLVARAPAVLEDGEADVEIAGKTVRVGRGLIDDLATHDLRAAVADLRRPLLIFHSPLDDFVDVANAARLFDAAQHPKSFISLLDADHLLLQREEDALFVAEVLAAWAARYFAD